jgi:TetR/AcrR family transcriptional regulator, transcriptional repressor for nem operon
VTARAIDGIEAMLWRVVETADRPCLGIGSICEFGMSRPDLAKPAAALGAHLGAAIAARVQDAQREGDAAAEIEPDTVANFLIGAITGIRVAGRGGADRATLAGLAAMALRALR